MAGVRGSGAGGEPDVVGVVTAGGEDLLAVDHILVAVTDSGGAQRREIGAGFGLGVTDGEVDLTGEDRGQELLLLLVGAVHLQVGPTVCSVTLGNGTSARTASLAKICCSTSPKP